MPRNVKEEVVFTAIMAGLMVLVMTAYNIVRADGFFGGLPMAVISGYPLGLGVAILLDLFVVGPVAKKVAFKYFITDNIKKNKPMLIGIIISICMVLGMVTFMSLFGLIVEGKLFGSGNVWATYGNTWIFNLMMALPLQLLIVGPIARLVLGKMQASTATETED